MSSPFGNIHERPDLAPLFGALSVEESEQLLETLVALDQRLDRLAEAASDHVGVRYRNTGLLVVPANISGGPSGDAGDIWFEIDPAIPTDPSSAPPYEVWSFISVFCDRELRGEVHGYACTHDLVSLTGLAQSPAETLALLSEHIEQLAKEVERRDRALFLGAPHDELPPG